MMREMKETVNLNGPDTWDHEFLDLRFLALLTSSPSAWPLPVALVRWVGWAA